MGKASSAKKVQRAARAGGRASTGQPRSLLFPGVLAVVILLGLSLVVYAREDRRSQDMGGAPQLGDHIHQALGIHACGEWLPDVPEFDTATGIHTHADGVIHVHPWSQLGVGANASLELFVKNVDRDSGVDMSLSDSKLVFMGETFEEGKTECEGVDDPELRVAYWSNVQFSDDPPLIRTGDFGGLRLDEDGAGITIFFGDRNEDIPKPPQSDRLEALGAIDSGQTVDPDASTTTVAGDETDGGTAGADGTDGTDEGTTGTDDASVTDDATEPPETTVPADDTADG